MVLVTGKDMDVRENYANDSRRELQPTLKERILRDEGRAPSYSGVRAAIQAASIEKSWSD